MIRFNYATRLKCIDMSFVRVFAKFANPKNPRKSVVMSVVVDPSFTRTCIPSSLATNLGLELGGKARVIEPISGRLCEYPESEVEVEIKGSSARTKALVSDEEITPVIGSDLLDKLGFKVNLTEGTLVRA